MSHFLYLSKIYSFSHLSSAGVSTGVLADSMQVSSASASEMIQKLALRGLVKYEKKHGALLTENGQKIAIQLRRAELLWNKFFVESLHIDIKDAGSYAKKMMEISDSCLTSAIDKMLRNPLFGVGGVAIPTEEGSLQHEKGLKMCDLILPYEGALVGVLDGSPSLISYLNLRDLKIGTSISIKAQCEIDGSYVLETKSSSSIHTISEKVASFLLIK